jgi:predicted flavoprotein YhiN
VNLGCCIRWFSIPTLGGSGIGYELAKQFGHQVFPTRAGLVPFTFLINKEVTTRLSGNALMTLSNDKNSFTEALLFTHRGLSGPSSLQLSNYWQAGESFRSTFSYPRLTDYLKQKKKAATQSLVTHVIIRTDRKKHCA